MLKKMDKTADKNGLQANSLFSKGANETVRNEMLALLLFAKKDEPAQPEIVNEMIALV